MKKHWLLILFTLYPFLLLAQENTDYNKKGDEALARRDYPDARMWYSEGVGACNAYSIRQLTRIWTESEEMRLSMRSLMSKCLNCLNERAMERDTVAISQLIIYYREGIGTPRNDRLANHWNSEWRSIRREQERAANGKLNKEPLPKEYFIGYTYSIQAPVGITAGMLFNKTGFYVRYKTNASFQDMEYTYRDGKIREFNKDDYYQYKSKKVNYYAVTGGLVVKCTSFLYASIGAGYFNRDLLYEYTQLDENGNRREEVWVRNLDDSHKGIMMDLDLKVKLGKMVYLNAGCSLLKFKYADLNAGIGVFF